jgi:hypothetical protein
MRQCVLLIIDFWGVIFYVVDGAVSLPEMVEKSSWRSTVLTASERNLIEVIRNALQSGKTRSPRSVFMGINAVTRKLRRRYRNDPEFRPPPVPITDEIHLLHEDRGLHSSVVAGCCDSEQNLCGVRIVGSSATSLVEPYRHRFFLSSRQSHDGLVLLYRFPIKSNFAIFRNKSTNKMTINRS